MTPQKAIEYLEKDGAEITDLSQYKYRFEDPNTETILYIKDDKELIKYAEGIKAGDES
jgi:hypothetical protein